MIQCKWYQYLFIPIFFIGIGCSDDDPDPPPASRNPIGLYDVYTSPRNTDKATDILQGFKWVCPEDKGKVTTAVKVCQYRYIVNRSETHTFGASGSKNTYASNKTNLSADDIEDIEDGDVYLHVQYRTCRNANMSSTCAQQSNVFTSQWKLDNTAPIVTVDSDIADVNASTKTRYVVSGTCTVKEGQVTVQVFDSRYDSDSDSEVGLKEIQVGCSVSSSTSNVGTWTTGPSASSRLDVSDLQDGELTVSATQTDSAGNKGSAQRTVDKNTGSPIVRINDTVGNITSANERSYSVSGTCTSGDGDVTVEVGTLERTASCSATGTWSVTGWNVSSLSDGSVVISATQEDDDGLTGSDTKTVQKNSGSPVVRISSTVGNITSANERSYSVSGTCTSGDGDVTVEVGTLERTASCSATGTWSVTGWNVSSLSDGSVVISATQEDDDGLTGSDTKTVQKNDGDDGETSQQPTITTPSDINSANVSSYSVSGTCVASGANLTVRLTNEGDGTSTLQKGGVSCSATGTWSVSGWNVSSLSDGDVVISATQATATSVTSTVEKDTDSPEVTITNASSYINAGNESSYSVSGACTSGDGDITVQVGTLKKTGVSCTESESESESESGEWELTEWDVSDLDDGELTVSAAQTDDAGNTASAEKTVEKDTEAPEVTIADTVENIKSANESSYSVSGACTSGDGDITVQVGTLKKTGVSCTESESESESGEWELTEWDVSDLADDVVDFSISATQADSAGNTDTVTKAIKKINYFVLVWKISDDDKTLQLPLVNITGGYNFIVDWGDDFDCGNNNNKCLVKSYNDKDASHTYKKAGTYTMVIKPNKKSKDKKGKVYLSHWNFSSSAIGNEKENKKHSSKLIHVKALGEMGWKDLRYAFYKCENLESGFLGGGVALDNKESQLAYMQYMFQGASSLRALDLSGLDTSKVVQMQYMFQGASSLTELDLSDFDTSSVVNMSFMFSAASSLRTLNLTDLDTSAVTTMEGMFQGASSLATLTGIENFKTGRVTNMSSMFNGAAALTELNLATGEGDNSSIWNVGQVEQMGNMFRAASSLRTLDLTGFDTARVRNMSGMFKGASSLATLTGVNLFKTGRVTNMSSMFDGAAALTELDLNTGKLGEWDVSSVTNMNSMFETFSYDVKLTLKIKGWTLNSGLSILNIFEGRDNRNIYIECTSGSTSNTPDTVFPVNCVD